MNPCVFAFCFTQHLHDQTAFRLKQNTCLSANCQRAVTMSQSSNDNLLSPDGTAQGTLPPFEVAKAWAFETVLKHMEKHLGRSAWMLIGEDKPKFIAKHLTLKGGGHPAALRLSMP